MNVKIRGYTMPDDKGKALLTDIGTEELGHVEMICTMLYQLTKDASLEELKNIKTNKLSQKKINNLNTILGVFFDNIIEEIHKRKEKRQ